MPRRSRPPLVVRTVAAAGVLLTLWHVWASFLWIFPPSPLRQLVPGTALSSYMLPMFGQSWSVFAPEPINGDYHFNVRATLSVDGEESVTGWVSASDVELSMLINHLFPARVASQAEEVASLHKGSWEKLGQVQREDVAANYFEADWEERLRTALVAAGDDDAAVELYMKREHMATAYATQVAQAMWGDEVERVQYRVSRQNIVPFEERNNPAAVRPEPQIVGTGWRGLIVEDGQNEDRFVEIFVAQYERVSGGRS